MSELLGEASSEGGPFLILDRANAEAWRGSIDERHYNSVVAVPFLTGALEFDGRPAVAWDAEGAGTVLIYRLAPDRILLQWAEVSGTSDVRDAAEEFASTEFVSGDVIVMWAPVAWEDLWEPPPPGVEAQLSMPSMLNVGLQVALPKGEYTFACERTSDAYRCWITRRP